MEVSDEMSALFQETASRIMRESGDPLRAIVTAAVEAGYRSGLVDPLYVSVEDRFGHVISAIKDGEDVSFTDAGVNCDLVFPWKIVISDEVGNGTMDVNIDAEESEGGVVTLNASVAWQGAGGLA